MEFLGLLRAPSDGWQDALMWAESASSSPPVPDGAETNPTLQGRSNRD